jgi:hypothetical protein
LKDRASVEQMTSGLMKMTYCSEAKSISTYVLQEEFIATKNMQSLLRQINIIIDFNIIYNELYANVNMKMVKHGDPL